jgi:phosphatidylglycerol---prolipoprotein diacylglyceryl transferase
MYPPVDPILLQLGPLTLRWYGLLIMAGVLAATWVAARYVARKGEDPTNVWDMLIWVLIPGLIGARLYYVFIQSPRGPNGLDRYLAEPASIFRVWEGGLHIFGGAVFGALAIYLYTRIRKLPLLIYLDGIALGLLLGQAIGRQANFINQELYGPPTTLPWGLRIDPQARIEPYNNLALYPDTTRFHPLFLYESLWTIIGFALIFWFQRRYERGLRAGDIALLYLIWYPLGRFFIEFLRTDSWFFPGTVFNPVHLISAIAVVGAAVTLYLRHREVGNTETRKAAEATEAEDAEATEPAESTAVPTQHAASATETAEPDAPSATETAEPAAPSVTETTPRDDDAAQPVADGETRPATSNP